MAISFGGQEEGFAVVTDEGLFFVSSPDGARIEPLLAAAGAGCTVDVDSRITVQAGTCTSTQSVNLKSSSGSGCTLVIASPSGVSLLSYGSSERNSKSRSHSHSHSNSHSHAHKEPSSGLSSSSQSDGWTCTLLSEFAAGAVNAVSASADLEVFVASERGLFYVAAGSAATVQLLSSDEHLAVAYSATQQIFFASTAMRVFVYQGPVPLRFEWASNISAELGGAYDGPLVDMTVTADGTMYAASVVCESKKEAIV